MGGMWFDPKILADSLSETAGYKAGLALFCNGSPVDRRLLRFIAGKLSLNSDTSKRPFVTVSNRPLCVVPNYV